MSTTRPRRRTVQIERDHTQQFARFLAKLSKMHEGDAKVPAANAVALRQQHEQSPLHNQVRWSTTLIDKVRGGQHINVPERTPLANVLLIMLLRTT